MTEYVMRFLNMLVARLLAQAKRLARLVAVRHEVTQSMVMSTNEEIFWQLGRDARTGKPLPPPFCDASAKDVARVIHDDLTERGLSCHAIRKIACALLGVSARTKLSPARRTRGEKE